MANAPARKRSDSASRVIKAPRSTLYQAFIDPVAVASWRPPEGMTARISAFEPRKGGVFRMAFTYTSTRHAVRGKTSEHSDVVEGRFLELIPDERIVERVEFESGDPAFAGAMTITTTLAEVAGGTEVTILCEDVPSGIKPADHQRGLASTLRNLAAFAEARA